MRWPWWEVRQLLNGPSVKGVVQGDSVPSEFIPKLIEFYSKGPFPFDRLITLYNAANIDQDFANSKSDKAVKPVRRFSSNKA